MNTQFLQQMQLNDDLDVAAFFLPDDVKPAGLSDKQKTAVRDARVAMDQPSGVLAYETLIKVFNENLEDPVITLYLLMKSATVHSMKTIALRIYKAGEMEKYRLAMKSWLRKATSVGEQAMLYNITFYNGIDVATFCPFKHDDRSITYTLPLSEIEMRASNLALLRSDLYARGGILRCTSQIATAAFPPPNSGCDELLPGQEYILVEGSDIELEDRQLIQASADKFGWVIVYRFLPALPEGEVDQMIPIPDPVIERSPVCENDPFGMMVRPVETEEESMMRMEMVSQRMARWEEFGRASEAESETEDQVLVGLGFLGEWNKEMGYNDRIVME